MKKENIIILGIILIMAVVVVGAIASLKILKNEDEEKSKVGSIIESQEYYATTTESGSGTVVDKSFKNGRGSLGSLVVTKAGDAVYQFLDASSTVYAWDNFPTSTRTLVDVPASLVAGTYIFDVNYNHGLYLDVSAGNTGTTTATYR